MQKMSRLLLFSLTLTMLSSIGCGGGNPSVSGKVTVNGEPVAMVRLVFSPSAVADSNSPRPYSLGVTDQEGRYSLKTRYGDQGAVVGQHKVGFEWADVEFDELSSLKGQLNEGGGDVVRNAEIQNHIDEVKQKLASRPKFNASQVFEVVVPEAGMSNADFELGNSNQ